MITVTKCQSGNSVKIYIGKHLRRLFKSDYVVVKVVRGVLVIREAMLNDRHTYVISPVNQISFCHDNATEFIGQWDYEVQCDEIRLIETE